LRRVQTSFSNPRGSRQFTGLTKRIGAEFSNNFFKKRGKSFPVTIGKKKLKVSYTHRFVCLSECNQAVIPKSDKEKNSLLEAGLGEKKITINDIDISSEEFHQLLLVEFPKLKESGGFKFAKCRNNSRILEPLSSLCLSSPRVLRDRVGNSRTYIIPLQRSMSLAVTGEHPPSVSCIVHGY